jgi:hypothetical protein
LEHLERLPDACGMNLKLMQINFFYLMFAA